MNESIKSYIYTILITAIITCLCTWGVVTHRLKFEYEQELERLETALAESTHRIEQLKQQIVIDNTEIERLRNNITTMEREIRELTESSITTAGDIRREVENSIRLHDEILGELEESRIGLEKTETKDKNNSSGSIRSRSSISSENFIIRLLKKLPWS